MKKSSYRSVAEKLGISEKTVYRVIHNTGQVHDSTRKKVFAELNKSGYFSHKQNNDLNVVFEMTTQSFFYPVAIALMEFLSLHNISFRVIDSRKNRVFFETLVCEASIVIWGSPNISSSMERIKKSGSDALHIVLGNENCGDINISMDSLHCGQLAAQHFHANGHSRIALCVTNTTAEHFARESAFIGEMKRLNPDSEIEILQGEDSSLNLVKKVIAKYKEKKITGCFCPYEYMACVIASGCNLQGIRIPDDISIVCCDQPKNDRFALKLDYIAAEMQEWIQWLEFLIMNRPLMTNPQPLRMRFVPKLSVNGSVKNLLERRSV